jgi:hypothetical protein
VQDVINSAARKASLDALVATGAPWDPAGTTIDLLTDAIGSVDPTIDLAALTAATPDNVSFPGYAQFTITAWGADFQDGSYNWFVDGVINQWIASADPPAPLTIVGYYYNNGTFCRVVLFDSPVVIERAGQAVTATPNFGYGQ